MNSEQMKGVVKLQLGSMQVAAQPSTVVAVDDRLDTSKSTSCPLNTAEKYHLVEPSVERLVLLNSGTSIPQPRGRI